jgi:hypothetical protein
MGHHVTLDEFVVQVAETLPRLDPVTGRLLLDLVRTQLLGGELPAPEACAVESGEVLLTWGVASVVTVRVTLSGYLLGVRDLFQVLAPIDDVSIAVRTIARKERPREQRG